jgi:hypothetical protein
LIFPPPQFWLADKPPRPCCLCWWVILGKHNYR